MQQNGVTLYELAPSLKQMIFDSNGSIIANFTSRFELHTQKDEIPIQIENFIPDVDALFVYKNSVSLTRDLDYTVSPDGTKIISTENGEWGKGNGVTYFDFVVLKNVKDPNKVNEIDYVDGSLLEDGSISIEKLTKDLFDRIHCLPLGGTKGAILVKNSDADYDISWSSNTVCKVIINTYDNKPVDGVDIYVKELNSNTTTIVKATGVINSIDLKPGYRYEIALGEKDGYKIPPSQVVTAVLGNINTIFFIYNTEMTECVITLDTEDNKPAPATTIFVRRPSTGETHEIRTDGVRNVYRLAVHANAQYEIYINEIQGYAATGKRIINTLSNGVSNVLLTLLKDEVFASVDVTGIEFGEGRSVDITFTDLKTDEKLNYTLYTKSEVVTLKSNTSYECKVNTEVQGFIKPANKYFKSGPNKSTHNIPLAYELSSTQVVVIIETDTGYSTKGIEISITDGNTFNKKEIVGESGIVRFQVMSNKKYTITTGNLIGYRRPESQTILTEGLNNEVKFIYKKVDIYGFELDLKNPDSKNNITYIENSKGFEPMRVTNQGVSYGDWLNTFIIKDVKPCAVVNGVFHGYLSLEEEGRMENGELIPREADLFAQFKKKYYSIDVSEDKLTFKISNYRIDGTYRATAFISEVDNKTECDYMYYGMYDAVIKENKLRSMRGVNVSKYIDINTFRTSVNNTGQGYNIENLARLNYVTLLTMLVSKCSDIKSFMGKPEKEAITITSNSYNKFALPLPNRTFNKSVSLFYINNLFNSPRFIEGCYLNGLKEVRLRKVGPYSPEANYLKLDKTHVNIPNMDIHMTYVKSVNVVHDILFPVIEDHMNDGSNGTYFGSVAICDPVEDENVHLILNNQGDEGMSKDPGFFNFTFVEEKLVGAKLTFVSER